jgi:polysaccharide pyruvyl transferase WcaK-like protein
MFVVLVGMEQLDRRACEALADRLPTKPPVFVSDRYDMYELVSLLRQSTLMLSSRYHAIVTSMPGRVPSAGVTMDERIRNLMSDRGHGHLSFEVDEPDLADKLYAALCTLERDREQVADGIARFLPGQLQRMGEMGMAFEEEVMRVYPDFPRRDVPRQWWSYLPPLDGSLQRLLETS